MQWISKRIFVFTALIFFIYAFAAEDMAESTTKENQKPARYLVVTYFHTTFRCYTCHKIEEYANDAISSNFGNELKSGKLVWRIINVDEPENKHYIQDYRLYTKSLIVSEMRDGKEVRWKNLPKVWTLIRDKAKFDEYVKTDIKDWLR